MVCVDRRTQGCDVVSAGRPESPTQTVRPLRFPASSRSCCELEEQEVFEAISRFCITFLLWVELFSLFEVQEVGSASYIYIIYIIYCDIQSLETSARTENTDDDSTARPLHQGDDLTLGCWCRSFDDRRSHFFFFFLKCFAADIFITRATVRFVERIKRWASLLVEVFGSWKQDQQRRLCQAFLGFTLKRRDPDWPAF